MEYRATVSQLGENRLCFYSCGTQRHEEKGAQGEVTYKNGTRTNDSMQESQEYVPMENNNNKEKEIVAWQSHGGWRIPISFAVFTFQLCPLSKTSVMSSSSIRSWIRNNVFRCLPCGVPVFQALKHLKDFKALHNVNEGMKKKPDKNNTDFFFVLVFVFVNGR